LIKTKREQVVSVSCHYVVLGQCWVNFYQLGTRIVAVVASVIVLCVIVGVAVALGVGGRPSNANTSTTVGLSRSDDGDGGRRPSAPRNLRQFGSRVSFGYMFQIVEIP